MAACVLAENSVIANAAYFRIPMCLEGVRVALLDSASFFVVVFIARFFWVIFLDRTVLLNDRLGLGVIHERSLIGIEPDPEKQNLSTDDFVYHCRRSISSEF